MGQYIIDDPCTNIGLSGRSVGKAVTSAPKACVRSQLSSKKAFCMPRRSATVSRVVGGDFPPPLNPAVENTTCTLSTNTDSNDS